ncbi:MvdC/MvdD family ATP grasp protein [Hoeflea sp. AS60]|uniref:MvdC/MvdD family ATP grasp protein n=1 Tax=Hoeflea sp. AS60 TaxID=3135780 RepID=UPI00317D5B49
MNEIRDTVLIVSNSEDIHAEAVQAFLANQNVPAPIFECAKFPTQVEISHDVENPGNGFFSFADGSRIQASRIRSIWWRRPDISIVDEKIEKKSTRDFSILNSRFALEGIIASLDCLSVNNIWNQRRALNKPLQLELAAKCGLAIPKTLISNSPHAVKSFFAQTGPTIYKALEKVIGEPDGTKPLQPDDIDRLHQLSVAPAIFQEFVEPGYDLRITYVGGKFFPAKISSTYDEARFDIRLDMGPKIETYALPASIQSQLADLMICLGLVFSAIDMRVSSTGKYYFLEANPAGQWVYVEMQTGQPITETLADLLRIAHQTV